MIDNGYRFCSTYANENRFPQSKIATHSHTTDDVEISSQVITYALPGAPVSFE